MAEGKSYQTSLIGILYLKLGLEAVKSLSHASDYEVLICAFCCDEIK